MHKGISSIIALVLVVMITVSIGGVVFLYGSKLMSTTTESATEAFDSMQNRQPVRFDIEYLSGSSIMIRNTGMNPVGNNSFDVYLGNSKVPFTVSGGSSTGEIANITIDPATLSNYISYGNSTMKISGLGFSQDKDVRIITRYSPMIYMKMDDNSTTLSDSSGNGNTGVFQGEIFNNGTVNGATLASGKYGNAANLDGINDNIRIPDSPSLDTVFGTEKFTLSAWVYPVDWVNYRGIINKRQSSYYSASPGGLFADSNGITFIIGTGNDAESSNGISSKPSLNAWHYVVAIANVSNMMLYIDGSLVGTSTITVNPPSNDDPLSIGSFYNNTRSFKGYIDSVRIWNRSLSYGEITAEMNSPFPVSGYGLVGDWEFSENFSTDSTIGTLSNPGRTCDDILKKNMLAADGVYWIDPDGLGNLTSVQVYCDMSTDGGGWTLGEVCIQTVNDSCWANGAVGSVTSPSVASTSKLSDVYIRAIVGNNGVTRGFWKQDYRNDAYSPATMMIYNKFNVISQWDSSTCGTGGKIFYAKTSYDSSWGSAISTNNSGCSCAAGGWSNIQQDACGLATWVAGCEHGPSMSHSCSSKLYTERANVTLWLREDGGGVVAKDTHNYVSGKVGAALQFDGVNDYVSISATPQMRPLTDSRTITAWVKTNSLSSSQIFYSQGDLYSTASGYVIFGIYNSNSLIGSYQVTSSPYYVISGTVPLQANTWMYLTMVANHDDDTISFYKDGVFISTNSVPGGMRVNGGAYSVSVGTEILTRNISGTLITGLNRPWNGLVDELMVFNASAAPDKMYVIT